MNLHWLSNGVNLKEVRDSSGLNTFFLSDYVLIWRKSVNCHAACVG